MICDIITLHTLQQHLTKEPDVIVGGYSWGADQLKSGKAHLVSE